MCVLLVCAASMIPRAWFERKHIREFQSALERLAAGRVEESSVIKWRNSERKSRKEECYGLAARDVAILWLFYDVTMNDYSIPPFIRVIHSLFHHIIFLLSFTISSHQM